MNCPIHKTKMNIIDFGFVSRQIKYFCLECNSSWMVLPCQIENPKPKLLKLILQKGVWKKEKKDQLKWLDKFNEELSKEEVLFINSKGEVK